MTMRLLIVVNLSGHKQKLALQSVLDALMVQLELMLHGFVEVMASGINLI